MKNYINDLVDRLSNLYIMYESYMWKHENTRLEVLIQDNSISFYLYDDKDVIDEIILSFSNGENKLYKYICIRMLLILFGNVIIRIDENIIYNNNHKSYLKLIVNDDEVMELMKEIINSQDIKVVNSEMDIIQDMNDKLPFKLFYPYKFMKQLDDRIGISKKLLRFGGRK